MDFLLPLTISQFGLLRFSFGVEFDNSKARSDAIFEVDISTRYFAKNVAGRNIDQISSKTPLHVDTDWGRFYSIFYSIFQVDIPRTFRIPTVRVTRGTTHGVDVHVAAKYYYHRQILLGTIRTTYIR